MTSQPLIVLAHGSRHPEAHKTISRIAAAVGGRAAFLDFSPWTLSAVAKDLSEQGHTRAIVVPLLFTNAFHLNSDVPNAVDEASAVSKMELSVTAGLGTGDDVAGAVARGLLSQWGAGDESDTPSALNAHQTTPQAGQVIDLVLYAVGSTTPGANESVRQLAHTVAGHLATQGAGRLKVASATAVFATGPGSTGVAAVHKAVESATNPVVSPLFVAEGLLWDKVEDAARAGELSNVTVGQPLGELVAPLVLQRASTINFPSLGNQLKGA